MSVKKRAVQAGFFLVIMLLTFLTLFHGKDLSKIGEALRKMQPEYLLAASCLALFFVSAEGWMIWYLMKNMPVSGKNVRLFRCIQYSFIGFFYSGITPSATGGQPVQLYYMNKDGHKSSESTVVLMTVAAVYKFVLVLTGIAILCFWSGPLKEELGKYFYLYLLGLLLNIVLVVIILGVMLFPAVILRAADFFVFLFVRMGIWKSSQNRAEKIRQFVDSYQNAVTWLYRHKKKLFTVIVMTFFQRSSVFLLTYAVYLGFGLRGTGVMKVFLLQASVYIAVDMLPLPGAQGITELMYQTVFAGVFTGAYLIPSMLVSRGINFYFLLLVSLGVVLINRIISEYKNERKREILNNR